MGLPGRLPGVIARSCAGAHHARARLTPAAVFLVLLGCQRVAPATSADAAPAADAGGPSESTSTLVAPEPLARASVVTDWCIDGLEALDAETCFYLPPAGAAPRRLLIYLHGIVPPGATSPQKEAVESAVRNAAHRAGWAAMIPRGRRGVGPGANKDWWAWPTTSSDYAKYAAKMAADWRVQRDALAVLAGGPFARTYLAGSSNGAYFVATLALRGAIAVDGFGAMSGGSAAGWSAAQLTHVPKPPFYVGYGAYDETNTGPKALASLLESAAWRHRAAAHPVAHGAKEIYLDEAFAFWDAEAAR